MKIGVIDIETSGLLSEMLDYREFPYKLRDDAKLWVVSVTDMSTMKTKSLVKEEITKESLDNLIKDFTTIVAHNGIKFDFISLKLFNVLDYSIGWLGEKDTINGREVRILDSLIMSRFSNPDRIGGHSLDSWGQRVGVHKTDYRGELIKLGVIESSLPKGEEFKFFHPLMVDYCEQDTITNAYAYREILKEYKGYDTARLGLQLEHKLADLAVRRESLGFWFDKNLALENLEELGEIMKGIQDKVNPLLPPKPLNKTELSDFTPPRTQFKKDGSWSSHMMRFFERHNITRHNAEEKWFEYKGNLFECPTSLPIERSRPATVDDLDWVKNYLMTLGWEPSEWGDRDLTRDDKKQILPVDKKNKTIERYVAETLGGKFTEGRLKVLGFTKDNLHAKLIAETIGSKSFRVPTSPKIRVGVTKEICPNLIKLGETVEFAKDVADYYTYRHRKSAIAGGDIEDMDFDEDTPSTGYLANYRDQDGRISTPAIELGAATHRYKHITVANIPRTSSLYGDKMRALFGAGKDYIQFGFDYSSLEARIQGHFVYPYDGGEELAYTLLQEKPNDTHSIMAKKLGIERTDAKSVNYMFMYGGSASKVEKMLGYSKEKAIQFHKDWWDNMLPLKQLKEDKEKEWIASGKKYIKSIDGRRINIRSQHSIINALFQSSGVIFAKYVTVLLLQELESQGLCIDVFKGKPDVAEMISYHDESQFAVSPHLMDYYVFKTEEEAKKFHDNWEGEQLGAVQKGKNCYYITKPSIISKSLTKVIKKVEDMFNIKVEMGYEYVTGRNWRDCH